MTDEAKVWARKPYKDLDLSDSAVLPDMAFDAAKEHVYVMTSHEVWYESTTILELNLSLKHLLKWKDVIFFPFHLLLGSII